MFWIFGEHDAWMTTGERARRQHSEWLTRALVSGRRVPRIPIRAVSAGGWGELMSRPNGRVIAERWWRRTLRALDEVV